MEDLAPEELVVASAVRDYISARDFFHNRIAELRSKVFVLRRLVEFPFDLYKPEERVFFDLATESLYETAILSITKLLCDGGPRVVTIAGFRALVMVNAHSGRREGLQGALRDAKFDECTEALTTQAKRLRDEHVAHWLRNERGPLPPAPDNLAIEDLEQMVRAVERLFLVLYAGARPVMIEPAYDAEIGRLFGAGPDIDAVLLDFARRNPIFRVADEEPAFWRVLVEDKPAPTIAAIRAVRARLGLPDA